MNLGHFSVLLTLLVITFSPIRANESGERNAINGEVSGQRYYSIEGKVVTLPDMTHSMNHFLTNTKVVVNYGQYFGFLRSDPWLTDTHDLFQASGVTQHPNPSIAGLQQ